MYRKVASIIAPILLVVLIGTSVWAYQEQRDKEMVLTKAENQYQRSFHNFAEHVDSLEDEMGKALALNSREQLCNALANVWRLAYIAQGDIAQLPLTYVSFDEADKFLYRTGNFAYKNSVMGSTKGVLSREEYRTLQTLYRQATQIQNKIQKTQGEVLSGGLRWLDSEVSSALSSDSMKKNTIADGFRDVDYMVKRYPETNWGRTVNNAEVSKRDKISRLNGKDISASEAKQIVAKFLGVSSVANMNVVKNNDGDYKTYSVRYQDKNGFIKNTDITVVGGYVVWMEADRDVRKKNLQIPQAEQRATQFLNHINHKNMVPISYSEAGNILTLTYVRKEGDVYVYPETVAIKVTLDNGEIVGFDGDEYIFNQIAVSQRKPVLTLDQIEKQVNANLKIEHTRLAIIYGEDGRKILCYEILGSLSRGDQYRLFIDGDTGKEVLIEKIKK